MLNLITQTKHRDVIYFPSKMTGILLNRKNYICNTEYLKCRKQIFLPFIYYFLLILLYFDY